MGFGKSSSSSVSTKPKRERKDKELERQLAELELARESRAEPPQEEAAPGAGAGVERSTRVPTAEEVAEAVFRTQWENPAFGCKRIAAHLRAKGITISDARCVRRSGSGCRGPSRRPPQGEEEHGLSAAAGSAGVRRRPARDPPRRPQRPNRYVGEVLEGSPAGALRLPPHGPSQLTRAAASAGLMPADVLVALGGHTAAKFEGIAETIVPLLAASEGTALEAKVLRRPGVAGGEGGVLTLSLTPGTWSGGGLLGCVLHSPNAA